MSEYRVKTARIIPFPAHQPSYNRRRLNPLFGNLTCLVLVKHGETEKALLVSDNGDRSRAAWCPKALLSIELAAGHGFIVATMSKRFAEQKGLYPRFIDPEGLTDEAITALDDASRRAARKRNLLRGHQDSLPYSRNVFA